MTCVTMFSLAIFLVVLMEIPVLISNSITPKCYVCLEELELNYALNTLSYETNIIKA